MKSHQISNLFFDLNKLLRLNSARSVSAVASKTRWGPLSLGTADCPHSWEKLKLGIVGAPLRLGQPHEGVSKAPRLIRNSGVFEELKLMGHDVTDFGDVQVQPPAKVDRESRIKHVIEFNRKLSELVEQVLKEDKLCITLGGDHAIGMGTVHGFTKAFENRPTCLLWIDAHADINTLKNSESGNMHGMPVSFNIRQLFEENKVTDLDMHWFTPRLDPKRLAFIGLRSVDPEERVVIDQLNIPCFSMREVDKFGIKEVTRKALEIINPDNNLPLHVSLDIDVLDPTEAPATGTKVPGGLTLREGLSLVEDLYETGCLRALDLVEVNPDLSDDLGSLKTLEASKRLLLASLGSYRGGQRFV